MGVIFFSICLMLIFYTMNIVGYLRYSIDHRFIIVPDIIYREDIKDRLQIDEKLLDDTFKLEMKLKELEMQLIDHFIKIKKLKSK